MNKNVNFYVLKVCLLLLSPLRFSLSLVRYKSGCSWYWLWQMMLRSGLLGAVSQGSLNTRSSLANTAPSLLCDWSEISFWPRTNGSQKYRPETRIVNLWKNKINWLQRESNLDQIHNCQLSNKDCRLIA